MSDREAGGKVSRSRVAEWEEPRHPGTASQESKYPTSSHSATQNPLCAPLRLIVARWCLEMCLICWAFSVGRISCSLSGGMHGRMHPPHLHARLRVWGSSKPRWGAKWEELASAC